MQPSPLSQEHSHESDSGESDTDEPQLASKLGQLDLKEVEIDVESLNPLSPEVISKQATMLVDGNASGPASRWRANADL